MDRNDLGQGPWLAEAGLSPIQSSLHPILQRSQKKINPQYKVSQDSGVSEAEQLIRNHRGHKKRTPQVFVRFASRADTQCLQTEQTTCRKTARSPFRQQHKSLSCSIHKLANFTLKVASTAVVEIAVF